MQKDFYFLSPVEVVKVTKDNLEEVAAWCGGKVAQTESRKVQGRMDSYVWVPTPKTTKISWAFPGMFVTHRLVINAKGEIQETWAVFRRDYFEKNYFETPSAALDQTWERRANAEVKKEEPAPVKTAKKVYGADGHVVPSPAALAGRPQTKLEAKPVNGSVPPLAEAEFSDAR